MAPTFVHKPEILGNLKSFNKTFSKYSFKIFFKKDRKFATENPKAFLCKQRLSPKLETA